MLSIFEKKLCVMNISAHPRQLIRLSILVSLVKSEGTDHVEGIGESIH